MEYGIRAHDGEKPAPSRGERLRRLAVCYNFWPPSCEDVQTMITKVHTKTVALLQAAYELDRAINRPESHDDPASAWELDEPFQAPYYYGPEHQSVMTLKTIGATPLHDASILITENHCFQQLVMDVTDTPSIGFLQAEELRSFVGARGLAVLTESRHLSEFKNNYFFRWECNNLLHHFYNDLLRFERSLQNGVLHSTTVNAGEEPERVLEPAESPSESSFLQPFFDRIAQSENVTHLDESEVVDGDEGTPDP